MPDFQLKAQESALRDHFLSIADFHERLSIITEACAGPGIMETLREDGDLVPGCVSKVWLAGARQADRLVLSWDAESPVVRGLAGLLCQVYQQAPAGVSPQFRTSILGALGLDRHLSPTRLRGLAAVEKRIHELMQG